ncbi:MAG: bifunctional precorrin-2 dehydrogenase/sirohydrochlorin ferrochelatase [Terriglobales bacterium]
MLFPIFIKLAGRRCLVVGGGAIAESKIATLLNAGAHVIVVAPQAGEQIQAWAARSALEWRRRDFQPLDVAGAFLAVAATNSEAVNASVFQACRQWGALCNVVDDPENCDFYYPAVVRRGPLQIAISTGGLSPAVARNLRQELEQQFGPEYEAWLEHVAELRRRILASDLDPEQCSAELDRIASRESFEEFVRSMKTDVRK